MDGKYYVYGGNKLETFANKQNACYQLLPFINKTLFLSRQILCLCTMAITFIALIIKNEDSSIYHFF